MIRIHKGDAPAALLAIEQAMNEENKKKFDAEPEQYLSGKKKFEFTDDYKIQAVVDTLRVRQYNKCCFSEVKFTGDFAHVEHYRPKGGVDPYPRGKREYPGYYWMAYSWGNLYLSKQLVNVSYKKNYFPMVGESPRNRTHLDNHVEPAVIIDPGNEDPRVHIQFHADEPYGVTERGTLNVRLLKLRHAHFEEARRALFKKLKSMKELVDAAVAAGMDLALPAMTAVVQELREATQPSAEFSSMAIDLLSGWPPLA